MKCKSGCNLVTVRQYALAIGLCLYQGAAQAADVAMPSPDYITGRIYQSRYDGVSDDLLTAGLGVRGLGAQPPGYVAALRPTRAELRRNAIYYSYKSLMDLSPGGGFGRLFGPNVALGTATGKVAGEEFLAFGRSASELAPITLMVQVPDTFDPQHPCIVATASPASFGVYGAVSSVGPWALAHKCAVAYTAKGAGVGFHFLTENIAYDITGMPVVPGNPDQPASFWVPPSDARAGFMQSYPYRVATAHAHAGANPEKDWGVDLLLAIRFAFDVLNRDEPADPQYTPANTIVIAAGISNGGGSALRATEADPRQLIDGVVAAAPNVYPYMDEGFGLVSSDETVVRQPVRPLFDYVTFLGLYLPCASLSAENAAAPLANLTAVVKRDRALWCQALVENNLLSPGDIAAEASDAQNRIRQYGILPDADPMAPAGLTQKLWESMAPTYANAYGRMQVWENLCGVSFGAKTISGSPTPLAESRRNMLFATGSGMPATGGIDLIYETDRFQTALCFRSLISGASAESARVLRGMEEIKASGDLHGRAAIIIHGRTDAVVPVNFASRPYLVLNDRKERTSSRLKYYEITSAQHVDANISNRGFARSLAPLQFYFNQALDLMYAHLTNGSALPPSQVIHPTPRGESPDGATPSLRVTNLPPITPAPGAAGIVVSDGMIRVPE